MVGGGFDEPVGLSRDESGRIVTTFSNPIADQLDGECVGIVPNFVDDPWSWDCIMYLTS
jgi:hypothetical protein